MKAFLQLLTIYMFLLISCSPGYRSHVQEYERTSTVKGAAPDYTDLSFWGAHPWKKDLSDSVPKPLRKLPVDTSVDVFFIHPTTLTDQSLAGKVWNADLSDAEINAKTDYTSMLYQASVFNRSARVFAPRYRQAHIYSFFASDTIKAKEALELAYEDIKAAFTYYLQNHNNGRPIIIAAHSQGTYHSGRLLKEFFEAKPLQKKLVCAYIIGLAVPKNYFQVMEPCRDSTSTGCFVTWRTFREGYKPDYIQTEKNSSWVTNPLTWNMDSIAVSRKANKGALLYNFRKIYKHTNGARIKDNVLWISKPKFPGAILLKTKNYHVGDINLFYRNIQENIETRKRAYFLENK